MRLGWQNRVVKKKLSALSFRVTVLDLTQPNQIIYMTHRVDRVLSFFSSRPNWDPPPSPAGDCPPLWFRDGVHSDTNDVDVTHSLAGEGFGCGVPIRTRGQTLWYSWYMCSLWYAQWESTLNSCCRGDERWFQRSIFPVSYIKHLQECQEHRFKESFF
jgi:hypothetical protein